MTKARRKQDGSAELARRARVSALQMVHRAKASHIGSALSMIDILSVLYSGVLRIPSVDDPARDRLIVSKGHAAVGLYAVLAEHGILSQADIDSYGQEGSQLLGHVSHKVSGVELSTGALGHGLSVGCGLALADRSRKVYVVCGDGEMQEGSVWEALMFAAHQNLANLTLVVDQNGQQGLGDTKDCLDLADLRAKLLAFGWHVRKVNGHDHDDLNLVFTQSSSAKPKAIIASTIKGKGVSFMENELAWHYKSPNDEQASQAMHELSA